MHIWDDKPSLEMFNKTSMKKMDYSHCPLKKRPIKFVKYIKEEMDFDNNDEYPEPENLSTKPQDLSVKCKPVVATVTSLDVKRESPVLSYQQHPNLATPPPSPSPYQHHHNNQYPYQPTAIKPGPLEPLSLNIAVDHHQGTAQATAAAYHHRHYAPAAPRPVPAQYPNTNYMTGYMYHQPGGLTAERGYPPATAMYPSPVAPSPRDLSLSPPGSSGSVSAFRPLQLQRRPSPPPAVPLPVVQSSAAGNWYNRGWSPSTADTDMSSHSHSSLSPSSSAVSPPYGLSLPPPPPPVYLLQPTEVARSPVGAVTVIKQRKPVIAAASSTGDGRYKCGTCTKTYSTVSGLTKHQLYHCAEDEQTAAAKTFRCKYCDKAYNTLGALKMHIRTHTLPCICTMCGKAFSRPWLLQGHIRTHTGEKPFSCQHCNRAFADRSNLRAHLQTHSDVKKYSCPTCSKTFSRMSLLTKHCDSGCPRLQPGNSTAVQPPELHQQ